MAVIIEADVQRIESTSATIESTLILKQSGFETDGNVMSCWRSLE